MKCKRDARTREEAERLFNGNMGLAYYTAEKYRYMFTGYPETDRNDAVQTCLLGLWIAACRFDEARDVQFSTYAYTCMYRQMVDAYRKIKRHNAMPMVSMEAMSKDHGDHSEPIDEACLTSPVDMENEVCCDLVLQDFLSELPGKTRQIVESRLSGSTQWEAARALNVSQPYVSRTIGRVARKFETIH